MFTGVSGSGKSSLVFETIAAESQRLINETYSAFVQGFMPTLARPDVDSLEGLTTAIILDQERMGANVRSTVGTVTDANAMLRVVFSRIGQAAHRRPAGVLVQRPVGHAAAARSRSSAARATTESRTFSVAGGMCPRCEGMGSATDIDLTQLYDETQVARRGRDHRPRLHRGRLVDADVQRVGLLRPGQADPRLHRDRAPRLPLQGAVKVRINGINLTYEGLVPRIQKSMLSKDVDALQPHIRAFVERAVTFSAVPRLRRHPAQRGGAVVEDRRASASPTPARCRSATWPSGCAASTSRRCAPLLAALGDSLDSFVEMGLGYLSLDRPSGTLSGGEAQRTRMIRHLGSSLTDVTYVFDEPTIGLHAHDVERMNALLRRLRDKGNTVLVVEHDPEVIRIADHVVDMGPGAGPHGGTVVYEGTVDGLDRVGHGHRPPSRRPAGAEAGAAAAARLDPDPERPAPQPQGRLGRRAARRAGRGDRGRRLRQELADPRLPAPDRTRR